MTEIEGVLRRLRGFVDKRRLRTKPALAEQIAALARADEAGRTDMVNALDELRTWLSNLQRAHAGFQDQLSTVRQLIPADLPLHSQATIPLETFDAGLGGQVVGFRASGKVSVSEGTYVGFEDYFRGREETIKERQRVYLPLLEKSGPVLDVGCGRGELLELLAESGVDGQGIDVDPAMVQRCLSKGLQVQTAAAMPYLERVTDGSLGTIVALQVIEHLPYDQLLAFLRTSQRKLRTPGRLVVETVNPHAPQALKHFWIDPTHQHPLFPETVIALCRLTGFASAYIWYPHGSGDPERDRREQFDYAVVAETGDSPRRQEVNSA